MTRCRLYSQQINNFLSRQQCWPVCVGVSHRPPSRAFPPSLLCTEGPCGSPQVPCPGLLPAVRSHHIQPSCDGRRRGSIPTRALGRLRAAGVGGRGGGEARWVAGRDDTALGSSSGLCSLSGLVEQESEHTERPPVYASLRPCLCWRCSRSTNPARGTGAPGTPAAAKHLALNPTAVCVTQERLHSCARSHEPVHMRSPLLGAPVCSSTHVHGRAPRVPLRHRSRHLQHRHLSHNMASSIEEICWEHSPFHPQHCVLFLIYIPRGGATGGRLFQLTARKAKKQDLTSCYSIRESEHSSPAAGCWQQRSHPPRRAQEKLLSAGKGLLPWHRGLRHGSQRRSQSPSVRLDASPPVRVCSWVHFLGKGLAAQSGRVVWGDSHGEQPGKEGKPRGCGAGGNGSTAASPRLRVGGFGSPLDVHVTSSVPKARLDRASRCQWCVEGQGMIPTLRNKARDPPCPYFPHTCALPRGVL